MTSPFRLTTFLFVTTLFLLAGQLQARTFKCWENTSGVRECGRVVPPEYSQSRIEIINERGLVVRIIEAAKSPEELAIEKEREHLRKLREVERKEQTRMDNILLNTYTKERDLILARDNNLKSAQGQIDISRGNLRLMQTNLEKLQQRAANQERAGHSPSKKLVNKITDLSKQVSKKKLHVEKKESDKRALEEHYAQDLKRFRELKSGRAN